MTFFIIVFLGLWPRFGSLLTSKLEPSCCLGLPRPSPKPLKSRFFGSMCPRCFPRGSKVAPRGSQGGPRSRFSDDFPRIWEPFFVIFDCENWLSQPKLQISCVLPEWHHHLKCTYLQTSSHMSEEGRRYVRSTKNFVLVITFNLNLFLTEIK